MTPARTSGPALRSLVVECAIEGHARLPLAHGRQVHGWFHRRLAEWAPSLDEPLHVGRDGARPFTLSPLWGGEPSGDHAVFFAGGLAWLRITTLDAELAEAVRRAFQPGDPVRVGPARGRIERVAARPGEHPWAHSSSYEQLARRWSASRRPRGLRLAFVSPTAFASGGTDLPLPMANGLIRGLARKWSHFAPAGLELDPLPDDVLRVARHDIHTEAFGRGPARVAGFVGSVSFEIDPEAPLEIARQVRMLVDYALFAGVGRKTTMAMGQVLPVALVEALQTSSPDDHQVARNGR